MKRLENHIHQFGPDKQQNIPVEQIYFATNKVKLVRKDDELKASISKQTYETIRKEVRQLGGMQESSEEELSGEELNEE